MKIRLDRLILTPVQAYILEKVRERMKGFPVSLPGAPKRMPAHAEYLKKPGCGWFRR